MKQRDWLKGPGDMVKRSTGTWLNGHRNVVNGAQGSD